MDTPSPCYQFDHIQYTDGIFDAIDATYIIHLEGNGRYEKIQTQLSEYHPTNELYIVRNKGYKKCPKSEHINAPALDLVDAFLQIFKHASEQNYDYILILEDDFIFVPAVKDLKNVNNIQHFLKKHHGENFQYLLGCMPSLQIPYDYTTRISIISAGAHSCIYSKPNRDFILKQPQTTIHDWDVYNCFNFFTKNIPRYMYYKPLCYQLVTRTENSDNWGKHNIFMYYLGKLLKFIFKLLRLDTQIEPGYSFFYYFSILFAFVILMVAIYLLTRIIRPLISLKKVGSRNRRL
jgi:hypothetical protein